MSDSPADALGSPADDLRELDPSRPVDDLASRTAALEDRVRRLEQELAATRRVVRSFVEHQVGGDRVPAALAGLDPPGSGWRPEEAPDRDVRLAWGPPPEEPPLWDDDLDAPAVRGASTASQDEPLECLACGHPIPADESRCPSCGWSYA